MIYRTRPPFLMTGMVVLEVSRSSPGQRVNGRYVPGASTTVEVESNVQPYQRLTGLHTGAEGDRHKAGLKVFARQKLYAVVEGDPTSVADTFLWDGDVYEVTQVLPWKMGHMDHYECLAVKKEKT